MNNSISIIGLSTSIFLPWACGAIWVYLLLRRSRWNGFIVAGHGYLIGVFISTLVIRLWDLAGLQLHFWGLASVLCFLAIMGLTAIYGRKSPNRPMQQVIHLENWQIIIVALLLLLTVNRYTTLTQEIILRPLFAWDSWMNWAPKAIVWFHHNSLIPYVSPDAWLVQTGDMSSYTLGNWQAWIYPTTVPLIQLFGMLGSGSSDHTALYLPWIIIVLALGMALYGHLRLSGSSVFTATLGCYLLLNLPYINIHTVLAGYADIWLAAGYSLAAFALHEWHQSRQWAYAFLSLIYAAICTQLKIPGIVLGIIIVAVFVLSLFQLKSKHFAVMCAFTIVSIALVVTIGVNIDLPAIGQIAISANNIVLPYIGEFEFSYHPVHKAFMDTFFTMLNWNLLWYLFLLHLSVTVARGTFIKTPSPELILIFLALLFIFFTFFFTRHYAAALSFTTLNRALLYVMPTIVFYICRYMGGARASAGITIN